MNFRKLKFALYQSTLIFVSFSVFFIVFIRAHIVNDFPFDFMSFVIVAMVIGIILFFVWIMYQSADILMKKEEEK